MGRCGLEAQGALHCLWSRPRQVDDVKGVTAFEPLHVGLLVTAHHASTPLQSQDLEVESSVCIRQRQG